MMNGFKPGFTITNPINAGRTRIERGPGVPGGRLSACGAQAGDPVRGLGA
jgi:hypothetical protein